MTVGWYVIYTKPRHEKKIAEYLTQLKFECLLPLYKTLKMWKGKKKHVSLPLFPSYIFIKLNNAQDYFDSLQIPGVLSYIRIGTQVTCVSESIINKLRSIAAADNNIEVSFERFNKGNILTIHSGSFAGYACEVIRHMGKFKILVRIEILDRNVIVDLPSNYLVPTYQPRLGSQPQ